MPVPVPVPVPGPVPIPPNLSWAFPFLIPPSPRSFPLALLLPSFPPNPSKACVRQGRRGWLAGLKRHPHLFRFRPTFFLPRIFLDHLFSTPQNRISETEERARERLRDRERDIHTYADTGTTASPPHCLDYRRDCHQPLPRNTQSPPLCSHPAR